MRNSEKIQNPASCLQSEIADLIIDGQFTDFDIVFVSSERSRERGDELISSYDIVRIEDYIWASIIIQSHDAQLA